MTEIIFDRTKSTKLLKHPWPWRTTLRGKGLQVILVLHKLAIQHHCGWHKHTDRTSPKSQSENSRNRDKIDSLNTLYMSSPCFVRTFQ